VSDRRWHNLTDEEIERIRRSFDQVWSVSQQVTDQFYARLFEMAPELRPLFRTELSEQKKKFISTLAVIVGSLNQVEIVLPMVDSLGRNHAVYGVDPTAYPIVGEALFWGMARGLDDHWTPEVAAAWTKAYAALSSRMIEAAER
jgi:hemoglobin-like flavoprotein